MSLVRRGDDSDLYIYEDISGVIRCSWCPLNSGRDFDMPVSDNDDHVLAHIHQHAAAGHRVPERFHP